MKKLLVWGIGNLAKRFIDNQYGGEIIGFIETNKSTDIYMGKIVYDSREIPKEYDYIIVANSYAAEIYNLCMELNMDMSKLIFLHRVNHKIGCTDLTVLKDLLLEKNYVDYCLEFDISENTFVKSDAEVYQKLNRRPNFEIKERDMWPVIGDKYSYAGTVGNYFWQDLWAAKHIIESGVKEQLDIGSRVDGFIAHLLAAGVHVTMIDVRRFPSEVENLDTIVDDATSLHQIPDGSVESMSALCSLEHFGLGRYGDPVDPEACFKCFENIQAKLKKGGKLYLSLPVGKERVEFNAHRIFYASTIVEAFSRLKLIEYSCAAEGGIEYNVDVHKYDNDGHNGEYRYGLFLFIKE